MVFLALTEDTLKPSELSLRGKGSEYPSNTHCLLLIGFVGLSGDTSLITFHGGGVSRQEATFVMVSNGHLLVVRISTIVLLTMFLLPVVGKVTINLQKKLS